MIDPTRGPEGLISATIDLSYFLMKENHHLEKQLREIEARETKGNPFLPPEDADAGWTWMSLLIPFWAPFRFLEFCWEERDRRRKMAHEQMETRQRSLRWKRSAVQKNNET